MYLQKCEEYFGGEQIGSSKNGELYKGIVCFMIVGFKESIPSYQVISKNNNQCCLAQSWAIWMPWCPDRIAAEHVLFHILNSFESFICQEHKEKGPKSASRTAINIYFNNKRKLSTDAVVKDKVKTFKRDKEKNNSK